jgi:hypothetical protein
VQLKQWQFPSNYGENADKMKNMQRYFPAHPPRIHWHYLVLIHRCAFKGRLDTDDTETLLQMLQGPMYDEAAFVAMETPLLTMLVSLRSELQATNRDRYYQYDGVWQKLIDAMQRTKDSSHRALGADGGRANEYLVFFRSQQGVD